MLEAIGAGVSPRIGDRDWADIWRDSPQYKKTLQEIDAIKHHGLSRSEKSDKKLATCQFILSHLFFSSDVGIQGF